MNNAFKKISLIILLIAGSLPIYHSLITTRKYHSNQLFKSPISETNWPMSNFDNWYPLPIKESYIDHQDELSYFIAWKNVMEEGISNRYNMINIINSHREKNDYLDLYYIFKNKQDDFLNKLQTMVVPAKLTSFHEKIVQATSYQIIFYEEWAKAKSEDSKIKFEDLVNESHLKACNELLWSAYYEFQRLYPNRDRATNDAIEMRLCQFDVI